MEKILIVEDDRPVQRILKRLFEFEGYGVEAWADGESALAAFHLAAPSAIVLDLNLPAMSGKDVCRAIKRESPALPIIVLSAITNVSEKVALLNMGADDYVTKPFSPRELLARVRAAIRRTHTSNVHDVNRF
jgi:DNA-binding response OmpR family regulator